MLQRLDGERRIEIAKSIGRAPAGRRACRPARPFALRVFGHLRGRLLPDRPRDPAGAARRRGRAREGPRHRGQEPRQDPDRRLAARGQGRSRRRRGTGDGGPRHRRRGDLRRRSARGHRRAQARRLRRAGQHRRLRHRRPGAQGDLREPGPGPAAAAMSRPTTATQLAEAMRTSLELGFEVLDGDRVVATGHGQRHARPAGGRHATGCDWRAATKTSGR